MTGRSCYYSELHYFQLLQLNSGSGLMANREGGGLCGWGGGGGELDRVSSRL